MKFKHLTTIPQLLLSGVIVAVMISGQYIWLNADLYKDVSGFGRIAVFLSDIVTPSCQLAGTFLGLLFSIILKSMSGNDAETAVKKSHKKALIFASFLSPVVLMSIYSQISTSQSPLLVFLIAYQNGFFWETVSHSMGAIRS